jgi:myo-inositol-1(or 4)-monophosphatase
MAREVAREVLHQQSTLSEKDIDQKDFHDYVTKVDKYAEEQIVDRLNRLIPGSSFLAEEGTNASETKGDLEWIIDPIDGTTNFIHKLPVFAISIALKVEGQLAMGIVHEVVQGESFYAWDKGEAFVNGKRIGVSKTQELGPSLLATGFPFRDFEKLDPYLSLLRDLMQHSSGIRRYGAAAVDLAYVAAGRFDAYFEYGLKPWDIAAGTYILEASGGKCSDFNGTNTHLSGHEILASNPYLYDVLLKRIKQHLDY